MIKWRLFSKSKETKETKPEEDIQKNLEEVTEIEEGLETEEVTEDKPLAEYRETLQSGKPRSKKYSISQETYEFFGCFYFTSPVFINCFSDESGNILDAVCSRYLIFKWLFAMCNFCIYLLPIYS